jgi:hypothetical protein
MANQQQKYEKLPQEDTEDGRDAESKLTPLKIGADSLKESLHDSQDSWLYRYCFEGVCASGIQHARSYSSPLHGKCGRQLVGVRSKD